ncbi:DNA-binding response regulator [Clostridia bacterium]|nr:DNA-binding response regulator [Clostridia bacterium]
MLKVLIADDEPIVREGLKTVIDWEANGFSICGDAEDGNEAIEKLAALRPDVALLDIQMPEKDGFAVSEYVKENHLPTKIVFLTGYDKFLYARRAIALGVKAYLLKPVDEDDLIVTLSELREEIRADRRSGKLADAGAEATYSNLMERLLTGQDIEEAVRLMEDLYNEKLDWNTYQVALVSAELDKSTLNELKRQLWEFLRFKDLGICSSLENRMIILIRNEYLTHEHPLALALRDTLQKNTINKIQLILSGVCHGLPLLRDLYREAFQLMDRGFLLSRCDIVDSGVAALHCIPKTSSDGIENIAAKLAEQIQNCDRDAALETVENIKENLMALNIQKEAVPSFYISLILAVLNFLGDDAAAENSSLLHEVHTIHQEIHNRPGGIEALEAYTKKKVAALVEKRCDKLGMDRLLPILEYMKENTEKDIKLKSLADTFNYNSAYLGKMLKNYLGVSFNEYMDHLKMERARAYIQEGYLVYEAAKMVGYANINYFNIKFKKSTGISPGAVKKTVIGNAARGKTE